MDRGKRLTARLIGAAWLAAAVPPAAVDRPNVFYLILREPRRLKDLPRLSG